MGLKRKGTYWKFTVFLLAITIVENGCHEKTLRKIVRSQSKMVQRPFSEPNTDKELTKTKQHALMYPGYAQIKSIVHKMQRPKMSTILTSADLRKGKTLFSRMNIATNDILHPYDLRSGRNAITDFKDENSVLTDPRENEIANRNNMAKINRTYKIPPTKFFLQVKETKSPLNSLEDTPPKEKSSTVFDKSHVISKSVFIQNEFSSTESTRNKIFESNELNLTFSDTDVTQVYKSSTKLTSNNLACDVPATCTEFTEATADIDAQEKFTEFDIEPLWITKGKFWNQVYESRYEALMRNSQWPALKVILVPRSRVDTIWRETFENLHRVTVRKIISNIVKKLQFYSNLTFSWNEVSHLSLWWKNARHKSRMALRRLVHEGRLEITTGGWVETDEATSDLFGLLHQLTEGHEWLLHSLNYLPEVAWLTKSVSHSPTLPYLLSASGLHNLVITNLHFAWQKYLTEYRYTDFVWIQNWDTDKTAHTNLNKALNKIGNERYPKHSVLTHYLPFNSDGFKACGPDGDTCDTEYNFFDSSNVQDINTFNIKVKAEKLLEEFSKTGTTSLHNVIVFPLGDDYCYESQTEFDFQYNNYQKIAEYVNINQDIYKASIEFGTSKDYFKNVLTKQSSYQSLKGDFLNFADVDDGRPAYWTGFFTTRPLLKIVLRRLLSTLRSTEMLFSFALNLSAFKLYKISMLYEKLLTARETVARLQDRHVVSGTLTIKALRYAQQQIINTTRDCWDIQETAISLLSSKQTLNETYLEKYIYREGELISSYKSVMPGDQLYVFNSLNHERIEIIELLIRDPKVRIVDYKENEMQSQINPIWKYDFDKIIRISNQFFKIAFLAKVAPLAFVLFKIEKTLHNNLINAATIYCTSCIVDAVDDRVMFPFDVRPVEKGDIQLANYKFKIIVDEHTGFLKSVSRKSASEQPITIDFGAFTSANVHSGMFLFNTNTSKPVEDILSPFKQNGKSRCTIIVSGQVSTELTSIYGSLLQHTIKIFSLMNDPLSDVIKLETKIDFDVQLEYRDMEIFMSVQTNIENGNAPELFIDNNGFQYTARNINVSRRVESNVYPFTSLAYIQDQKSRLTIVSDHAQGVTVLQEGQLLLILDRRMSSDDNRGSKEGITENNPTIHTHYLLLETFMTPKNTYEDSLYKTNLKLPSQTALYFADTLNYNLDIYFINANRTHLCHYSFLSLVKASFPCDVALINYRTVLNRGTPANYTPNSGLMTLHRYGFSCRVQSDNILQCSTGTSFKLDSILRKVKAVYQTNLVGTTEGTPITVLNKINFPLMELTTLRIHF